MTDTTKFAWDMLDGIADIIRATPSLTGEDVHDIAYSIDWDEDIDVYVSDTARPLYDAVVTASNLLGRSAESIMDMVTTSILGW